MSAFMFATGIENSYPTIRLPDGTTHRVDELEKTSHYQRWREDFDLIKELGLEFLRYGPPYYRVHTGPNQYDWTFTDQVFGYLRELGITPIVDLLHFGLPDWLNNFQNPEFPTHFAAYAQAFAARFSDLQFYTPINEIFVTAKFSAQYGWWNECLASDQAFVTALKHLCRANVLAMQAILGVQPGATFIQSESAEYFHPETPAARQQANFLNQQRFLNPPKVESTTMMWVAGVGLLVNLYGVYLLRKSSGESLNMKGAYFEVLSDMLTSVGVLVAGVIMLTTKWYYADPLLSAGIGLFILPRTWVLLKEAVDVLLESTPKDVDLETLRQGLLQVPGVAAVHDLHAWVLTSGVNALSVHVVLAGEAEHEQVLARTHEYITGQHPIQHATIQVERGDFAQHETHQ